MPAATKSYASSSKVAAKSKKTNKMFYSFRRRHTTCKRGSAGSAKRGWVSSSLAHAKKVHKGGRKNLARLVAQAKKYRKKQQRDVKQGVRTKTFPRDNKRRRPRWAFLTDFDFPYTKEGMPDRRLKVWEEVKFRKDGCVDGRSYVPFVPLHSTKFNIKTRVLLPRGEHQHTLIYLHGFQRSGEDYTTRPYFFFDDEKFAYQGLKVVVPSATCRPISVYCGAEMSSWVDYWSDNRGQCEDEICPRVAAETRERIHAIIDREISLLGDRAGKVFVGGCSQGCATALDAALSYPRVLGGVVGIVGHLHSATKLPAKKKNLPIYLYNGGNDRDMQWEWVRKTFTRFTKANYNKVKSFCTKGVGHHAGDWEGIWMIDFLSTMIKKPKGGWKPSIVN